ncbi:hypothetical protein HDU97_004452 [Phlyctochytrium planicorne]|nr:hypothetical protein HDU97_004452 [Phlyctochytrium planicorne]
MMASHELVNLRPLAYAMVARFLHDNGHLQTLEMFRAEASDAFDDVEGRVLPYVDDGMPLLGVLEQHLVQEMKKSEGMKGGDVFRDFDKVLGQPSDGKTKLPTNVSTFETIHHANVLCVATTTLKSTDISSDPTEPGTLVSVLLTSSTDKSLRVSHAGTGKILAICDAPTKSPILSIDVHPRYSHIVLGSCMDGSMHLFDLRKENESLGGACQSFKDHAKYVVRALFGPAGKIAVSASHDRTVKVYKERVGSVEGGVPQFDLAHTVNVGTAVEALCLTTLKEGDREVPVALFSCREDNLLHCIDLSESSEYAHTLHNMNSEGDNWVSFTALDLAASPSGKHLAIHTDSAAGRIILARMPRIEDVVKELGRGSSLLTHVRSFYGVLTDAFSRPKVAWNGEGKWVAATSDDGSVHIFEAASGRCLGKLEGHAGIVRGLAEVEGNGWMTCSFDKSVRVWK